MDLIKMYVAFKFVFVLAISIFLVSGSSGTIGVTPAKLSYEIMKGEPSSKQFKIQNQGDGIKVNIDVSCPGQEDIYNKSWIVVEPSGEVEILKDSIKIITVTVKTSADAANGNYTCYVGVMPIEGGSKAENRTVGNGTSTGTNIIFGSSVRLDMEVSGDEIIKAKVFKTHVSNAEVESPVVFTVEVRNFGNVRIKPKLKVDIIKDGRVIGTTEKIGEQILPSGSGIIKAVWEAKNVTSGNYTAHFDVFLGDKMLDASGYIIDNQRGGNITIKQDLPFTIFNLGTFTRTGSVAGVNSENTINIGDVGKTVILFKNTGLVEIKAKSKIEVYSDNRLIDVLESDMVSIPPGEAGSLTTYFKGAKPGLYILKGKVIYEGKEVLLEDIQLKVNSTEEVKNNITQPQGNGKINNSNNNTGPTENPTENSIPLVVWLALILLVLVITAVLIFIYNT